jgi:hypothetical protein
MRTVVSIYILIPLILVPQLLLGGAMIKFDDLHKSITNKEYVPVIGDVMATRWAYEAIMVEGYKSNKYNKASFNYRLEIEQNNYYKDNLIKNLKDEAVNYITQKQGDLSVREKVKGKIEILNYHINQLSGITGIKPGNWVSRLKAETFTLNIADSVKDFLDRNAAYFIAENRFYRSQITLIENAVLKNLSKEEISRLGTAYNNKRLEDIVLNQGDLTDEAYSEIGGKWVQKTSPVFMKPTSNFGRAHFYAPYKLIANNKFDTIVFNMAAMWILILLFAVTLYFNLLKRFIDYLESLRLPFWRKFGRT